MKLSKHNLAIIALVIANMIWGAAAPIFKWSLQDVQPFTLAFLRFLIGSLLLLPFVMHKLHIKKEDWPRLALLALSGVTFNIAFFFLGLQLTSSVNAPMIASSAPVFLILGSIIFLGERPKSKIIYGTMISLLGVLMIIVQPILEKGIDGSVIGNLFFILSTISGVGHTILLRDLVKKYNALSLTFWSFFIGMLGFLPMLFPEVQKFGFLQNVGLQGVVGILFGGVLCSALAYVLFALALKHMIASEVGVFVYLDPIIAVFIALPLLGETITTVFLLGSLLVFTGIFIAEGRLHYHPLNRFHR